MHTTVPVIFWGVRNDRYHSYNSTIIEIGAQKSQSGPIAWPNVGRDHGLRTPNEGIDQGNPNIRAHVADKISFGRT